MNPCKEKIAIDLRAAKSIWSHQLTPRLRVLLRSLTDQFGFSVGHGDLALLDSGWYVTHTGLIRLAQRNRCAGIDVRPARSFCNPASGRWAFKAIVYKSRLCKGFAGYGDADPSNVSPLVRGAEMRVAETRAVNRALRKAYGIGICSIEELGSLSGREDGSSNTRKFPPRPAKCNGNGKGQPRLRDQLCLLIRQHGLDASLVKRYATEFCAVPDLRQASREQIQGFITHLKELAARTWMAWSPNSTPLLSGWKAQVPHETSLPGPFLHFPAGARRSGWGLPGPRETGPISAAAAEAFL